MLEYYKVFESMDRLKRHWEDKLLNKYKVDIPEGALV